MFLQLSGLKWTYHAYLQLVNLGTSALIFFLHFITQNNVHVWRGYFIIKDCVGLYLIVKLSVLCRQGRKLSIIKRLYKQSLYANRMLSKRWNRNEHSLRAERLSALRAGYASDEGREQCYA